MKQRESGRQLLFWLAGFVIGVLFLCFAAGEQEELNAYMGMQSMVELSLCRVNRREYLAYLLKRRGMIFLVLLFGAMTMIGNYILCAFVMFLGISMGMMSTYLVMHYGGNGILLLLALFFPQIICYTPAVCYIVRFLLLLHDRAFARRGNHLLLSQRMMSQKQIVFTIGVTITGILSECYVNPILVKIVMKIL